MTTADELVLLDLPVTDPLRLPEGDVEACLDLLDERGAWLHDELGITDQWPRSMRDTAGGPGDRTFDRVGELVTAARAGTLWGIREITGRIVACAVVDERADPDYVGHYPPTAVDPETGVAHAEPRAFYVHRMATALDCAGYGLGARLLSRAVEVARDNAGVYLRLECARGNARLKRYYVGQGFRQVNEVEVAGRYSGALFEKVVDHTRLGFALGARQRELRGLG